MAKSGSFNTGNYEGRYLQFAWEVASQSIANNTTTISWTLKGAGEANNSWYLAQNFKVTIDGNTVFTHTLDDDGQLSLYNGTLVASGTYTFTHNSEGVKSFSAYAEAGIYNWSPNCSGSGTWSLDTIPRKSTLSVSNGTLGTAQTLTVTKKSSSFTHTITYKCGGETGTVCTKSSATSISWTPPNDLANQAPSDNSVKVEFTITTYNGNANVGSSSPDPITCAIPYTGTFVPVLMPTTSDANGHFTTYGAFVQGQSKLKVDIQTYGAYGAWITSVQTEFDGAIYPGTSVESNTITKSGSLPLKITVTDSRGRQSISETTITVLAYEMPKINSLTVARCDANGNIDASGVYLLAKFNATISALNNKNTATYYIGYKKTSEAEHTAVHLSDLSGKYSVNSYYIIPAEAASSYTVIFNASDAFGQSRTTATAPSVSKVLSLLKKNGEIVGAAFGKIAEHEGVFEVGWRGKFTTGDCVVEQGTLNGWTYRKWDSGVAECWKSLTHRTAITTAWGALYHGTATSRQSYPFSFVDKPVEQVTLTAGSYQAILFPEKEGNGVNGASASACYNVCRPSQITTTMEFYLNYHVKGKWK